MNGMTVPVIVLYDGYYAINHVDLFSVASFEEYYGYIQNGVPRGTCLSSKCHYVKGLVLSLLAQLYEVRDRTALNGCQQHHDFDSTMVPIVL
ncbi:hypothetical protein C922_05710 [Plasmodium inui San Antonio 1]|uniref:Uncharacterized protein n=1 Tax=Plasmodium inui San Antonio 1 TaxID=1237626 RepID=W6ZXC4_9APIC|nr:hypothetical protein C922_05710 [Plasmodium inui San Antonio 1]EUD63910.1 hypothetical protein C922_05710 [Plasmodium inui San Antonio 1]